MARMYRLKKVFYNPHSKKIKQNLYLPKNIYLIFDFAIKTKCQNTN